jgi:hypothetical protein
VVIGIAIKARNASDSRQPTCGPRWHRPQPPLAFPVIVGPGDATESLQSQDITTRALADTAGMARAREMVAADFRKHFGVEPVFRGSSGVTGAARGSGFDVSVFGERPP